MRGGVVGYDSRMMGLLPEVMFKLTVTPLMPCFTSDIYGTWLPYTGCLTSTSPPILKEHLKTPVGGPGGRGSGVVG